MKNIFVLGLIIFTFFFGASCSVTKNSLTNKLSEAIRKIEELPSSSPPELLAFEQIFSSYDRIPSRGLKMGYRYNNGDGYEVVLLTHSKSFNQVDKHIDDIINGKNGMDRESVKVFIKKCIIRDINGKEVFLREWQ